MSAPAALARYETNEDVSRRRRALVARLRVSLLAQLGGRCVRCGRADELSFDHPSGRSWIMSRYSQHGRLVRIRSEMDAGLIQCLCLSCNRSSGGSRRYRRPR